jgi:hypothetical protein
LLDIPVVRLECVTAQPLTLRFVAWDARDLLVHTLQHVGNRLHDQLRKICVSGQRAIAYTR